MRPSPLFFIVPALIPLLLSPGSIFADVILFKGVGDPRGNMKCIQRTMLTSSGCGPLETNYCTAYDHYCH